MTAGRIGWALALVACLALLAGAGRAPEAWPAFVIVFALAPGAWLAERLWPHWTFTGRALAALALSPAVAGGPAAILLSFGVAPQRAAMCVVAFVALLALHALLRPAPEPAADPERAHMLAAWGSALAWGGIVAALLLGNPWLPPRSDGWFHGAVVEQLARRGAPPEDPYFAGLRLLYFWGWHAWGAMWDALAEGGRIPLERLYAPFITSNISGAVAVVLGIALLARRLGARARIAALACLIATCGYAPFGWVQIVGRAFTGKVRGWAELHREMSHGAGMVLQVMSGGLLHASLAFFGDKYLVLTSFGLAFAVLLLAVLCLCELAEAPGVRTTLALAAALAATLFTHSVVGDALVLLCGAWWAANAFAAARGDARARALLVPLALAAVLALAVTAPYLLETTVGKHDQFRSGFYRASAFSFLLGGLACVPAAFVWLGFRWRAHRDAALLLVFAVILSVFALALRLPENNQSKFLNLLWLLTAAPAALGWERLGLRFGPRMRALYYLALAGATLPSVALALWGFATDHGQGQLDRWHPLTVEERAAWTWLRDATPPDAAVCDLGGAQDVTTYGAHSVLWGGRSGERDWGYPKPELAARRHLVGALCRGEMPPPDGAALLGSLHREVLVLARADAPDSLSDHGALATQPARFEQVFHNAAVTFYRVRVAP